MAGVGVRPYWELTFDADGDVNPRQRDALLSGVVRERLTDVVVFSHGWNNDRSMATRLYSRVFEPFPELLVDGRARLGYVGVLWPALRFTDEPIPDFDPSPQARSAALSEAAAGPALRAPMRQQLAAVFPGRELVLQRITQLLAERPDARSAFDEFARLVRELISVPEDSPDLRFATDSGDGTPGMLTDDALEVCEVFTAALRSAGAGVWPGEAVDAERMPLFGGGLTRLWNGAHELLRQGGYYAMKRRAGTVGQLGLGPVLGGLADAAPALRVHLAGHSFGGRLVSYALRGMPRDNRSVKSVTLLQGAFSHYAFTARLPYDEARSGALNGMQQRIDGPLVACHSVHDEALGTFYPLASKLAGDSASFLGLFDRWGAIGFDGIQAVDGARRIRLGEAVPTTGCVSVDASAVVRRGAPPAGAHSDICHPELARVITEAGRIGRG
ncbi:serine-threonine protein kinase [Streptomyces sp. Ru73]|uniref:serine-threonine protein kinase n=1 Tax=Streptomyces sp. Ru73 TaxID=2080748 RepID=UPI000CDDCE96|nr:serine-threonine protein kinase [Streptomyces sp. Ru73]POX39016.1 serine-threonine protein kinase [Streptomyces sp. Ru73]